MHRHIKPTEPQKRIKLIIYNTKLKTSNLIVMNNTNSPKTPLNQSNVEYQFTCPFRECLSENNLTPTLVIQQPHSLVSLPTIFPTEVP